MAINTWLNTTVERSHVLVPTHGRGMGDVCPKAAVYTGSLKRRTTDAFQATAPGSAGTPWSPPVT